MSQKALKSKIYKHKFNGVLYHVDTEPFLAACDNPGQDRTPCLMFPNGIKNTKDSLCHIIHESIHASAWDIPEAKVHDMGREIGTLLWKLGFRLNM